MLLYSSKVIGPYTLSSSDDAPRRVDERGAVDDPAGLLERHREELRHQVRAGRIQRRDLAVLGLVRLDERP